MNTSKRSSRIKPSHFDCLGFSLRLLQVLCRFCQIVWFLLRETSSALSAAGRLHFTPIEEMSGGPICVTETKGTIQEQSLLEMCKTRQDHGIGRKSSVRFVQYKLSNVIRIHGILVVANQPYQDPAIGEYLYYITLYNMILHTQHRLATCNDQVWTPWSRALPAVNRQTWQTMMQLSRPCTTRSSRPQEAWMQEPQLLLHFFARLPDNSFKCKMFLKFVQGTVCHDHVNQSTKQTINQPANKTTHPPSHAPNPPNPLIHIFFAHPSSAHPTPAPPHHMSHLSPTHVIGPIPPVFVFVCVCVRQHATKSFVYK